MEDYKSNSDKARQEQQSEKKVEAVITGAAKTRKKGEMQKFADVFIAEDANNVKSYILMEVIVPAVKKAISDIVTTGIDMILYGEAGRSKKNGTASKESYRNYYDQGTDRVRAGSVGNRRNTPDYDDILFDTRGDAEAVLDAMNDIKSITLIREGVSYNILNCLDKNTDWFTLAKGDNIFAFTADSGVTNLQFRIENKVIYEGV